MSRGLRPLATIVVIATISAGCASAPSGSGSSNGAVASAGSSNGTPSASTGTAGTGVGSTGTGPASTRDKAVQFSECMRDRGVSGFPDPDPSGALTLDGIVNGSSLDPNSTTWKRAIDACKDLEPPGFTGHQRNAQEQKGALAFAQCVRDHGVRDFPDPSADQPLVDTNRIPSTGGGVNALNTALRTCSSLLAAAGVTGP